MARETINQIGSPGIIYDVPAHSLGPTAWTDGSNIRFGEDGVESFLGDQPTFSTASVSPLWIQFFPPITGPRWVYTTLTEAWCYQGSTHTEITRASGDYNAIATERWHSTMFNGIGILNNTIDVPQMWTDIDSTTALADLTNWTSTRRCKSLKSFKNFLVALYMTDSSVARPYRILWSDSADTGTVPGSWDSTDPTTDSREFDLAETSDYLVDQLALGDVNIIYKENSTWGMQYIGPPFYFRFWKILSKNGMLHRDCVVNVPFGHCVVTQDDIIVHSGAIEQSESIVDAKMRNWIFNTIDPDNFKNSFLLANPRSNEVLFFFPESGETYASIAVVWNYKYKSLGIRELSATIPFGSSGPVGESITDDPGWDDA